MNDSSSYNILRQYITPDETLLWQGRPEKRGNLVTKRDLFLIPFGFLWTCFTVFWEVSALRSGAGLFFALWGVPFIGAGVYMLAGRFIHTAYLRDKTFYAVTNKKIIIKAGNKLKILDGKSLPPMDIEIHKNGNGSIVFTEEIFYNRRRSYTYVSLENLSDYVQAQNAISSMDR
ncbi:MAG: PH domain-containing protein [Clostridia bacterium]|nr:PH domain-containing protein [Clostridia bacterium]